MKVQERSLAFGGDGLERVFDYPQTPCGGTGLRIQYCESGEPAPLYVPHSPAGSTRLSDCAGLSERGPSSNRGAGRRTSRTVASVRSASIFGPKLIEDVVVHGQKKSTVSVRLTLEPEVKL